MAFSMTAPCRPHAADAAPSDGDVTDLAGMAATLMQSRQTILPKRLAAPGPDAGQLELILNAAASAPDHGQLLPWRFVIVPQAARAALAGVFGAALLARDAGATPEQVAQAQEKAYRSPLLMLAVVDGGRGDADIDLAERTLSAGCAVQNMLLMATALGFGSALTSGKALKDDGLRRLFGLGAAEQALCFVSLGTVQSRKAPRLRPLPADFVESLLPGGGVAAGWPPAGEILF
ncbi:MAG: nitroreductase family protein [Polaromonas sp.]